MIEKLRRIWWQIRYPQWLIDGDFRVGSWEVRRTTRNPLKHEFWDMVQDPPFPQVDDH